MAPLPTILVIPGSYSSTFMYTEMANQLTSYGYDVVLHELQTASRKPPQEPANLRDDVAFFHGKISGLVEEGRDVVVFAHSYGGVVSTGAVKGLSKAERSARGLSGGVVQLIYLTAVIGREGKNMLELMDSIEALKGLFIPVEVDNRYGTHVPEVSAPLTMSDMPIEDGIKWVKRMPYQAIQSFMDPIEASIPQDVPISYIFCTEDAILPPWYQQERIALLEEDGSRKVNVLKFHSGHCPNISKPKELAQLVQQAVMSRY